jgi:Protein of unknown function (DUF998)
VRGRAEELTGAARAEELTGAARAEELTGAARAEELTGAARAEELTGAAQAEELTGAARAEELTGSARADELTGSASAGGGAHAAMASAEAGRRDQSGPATMRRAAAWVLGLAGVVAYNWWLLVPLKPGLMTSPDELFSNLEVTGQPYATLMQHADVASGLLLLAAFAVTGPVRARRDWLAMLAFAAAGALGGLYPEVCADGISATCRRLEWRFELPATQYIHMAAGIAEFAAITIALLYALGRTKDRRGRPARVYRGLARSALIGYPLLGATYLSDRLGGIMEAVFFIGFTVMVITELAERTAALHGHVRSITPRREPVRR